MARDAMVLWVRRGDRVERLAFEEPLRFYVHSKRGGLTALARALEPLADVLDTRVVERRLSLEHPKPRRVLEVAVHRHRQFRRVANLLDGMGRYRDHQLFNVDLNPCAQFLSSRGLFPLARVGPLPALEARDEAWAMGYDLPPLHVPWLDARPARTGAVRSLQDPLGEVRVGDAMLEAPRDGDEAALLRAVEAEVARQDPDGLLTRGGDDWLLPWLYGRAQACGLAELRLGREPSPMRADRAAKSFFTYGRIEYHAPFHTLRGRWHIDAHNSWFHREGGLRGIWDLARTTGVPVQTTARLGAGSAITMMQVHKAVAMGFLVPWKKTRPEDFKTGLQLLATDKGGYIFEPRVGLHEGAVEVDFASMYPHIMVRRNVSPETLNCACCARGDGLVVPGIGSYTCTKRIGLVPRYLQPVLDRRFAYKRLAKELAAQGREEEAAQAKGVSDCLKWCLLVSFGYQGYRNARFGRLECHEAISAWARDVLLSAAGLAEDHGWQVLHGIVDSLWLKPVRRGHAPLEEVRDAIAAMADIDLAVEGAYSWIVFLPTRVDGARGLAEAGRLGPDDGLVGAMNRYYGRFEDGTLKARGIEVRRSDTCAYVARFQEAALAVLGEAEDARGFRQRIPGVLRCLAAFARALRRGEAPGGELVLRSTVSQPLAQYRARTAQVSALRQLAAHGVERQPGQAVRYVVTDRAARDLDRKAKPVELWAPEHGYDAAFYVGLLARAAESLLLPMGWTETRLLRSLDGRVEGRLEEFTGRVARGGACPSTPNAVGHSGGPLRPSSRCVP